MILILLTLAVVGLLILGAVVGSGTSDYSVGDNVRIYESGLTTVTVAVDGDAFDALTSAAVANDAVGYENVLLSGRAFTVPNGTRALVLDKGFTKTKVRVMEGANAGQAGYVPREWVEKD